MYVLFMYLADMPQFMGGDRIVGGAAAPSMIPWQVAILSGDFQFCGGTVLDACTVLSAAHCQITTSNSIRAGSLDKTSGGQVCSLFCYDNVNMNTILSLHLRSRFSLRSMVDLAHPF